MQQSSATNHKSAWRWLLYRPLWLLFAALFSQLSHGAQTNPVAVRTTAPEFAFLEPNFENVGDTRSIPGGNVTALAQDQQGLIWIGTQVGLIRYDGYHFRKFTHIASDINTLAGDFIKTLLPGADGRLWIGTRSDGLSVYDPNTGRFENHRHDPKRDGSISDGIVQALAVTSLGGVWAGTEKGLNFLPPGGKTFVRYQHNPLDPASLGDDRVRSLLLDKQGKLWVGTVTGLQRLRQDGKGFEPIATAPNAPDSLAGKNIQTLFEAQDGKLWLGTAKHGAAWLQPDTLQLHWLAVDPANNERLSYSWIKTITQPQADQIWLGSVGGGINIVDAADGRILQRLRHDASVPSSLADDQVSAFLADQAGLLWIGTSVGGLQRHNMRNAAFRVLRHSPAQPLGLTHANVRSVLELADGKILAGTQGNGIDIFDRQRGRIGGWRAEPIQLGKPDKPGELGDGVISALAQTPDGTLWAGTQQAGVFRRTLAEGADITVGHWQALGTAQGLPDVQIFKLFVSRNGDLWAGTRGGLARWQAAE
jgi:ligand-binding sensor domain-containing protein